MVMEQFGEGFNMNIIKIDAKDRFLNKLKGVSDPEQKRKIIGNEFIYIIAAVVLPDGATLERTARSTEQLRLMKL